MGHGKGEMEMEDLKRQGGESTGRERRGGVVKGGIGTAEEVLISKGR